MTGFKHGFRHLLYVKRNPICFLNQLLDDFIRQALSIGYLLGHPCNVIPRQAIQCYLREIRAISPWGLKLWSVSDDGQNLSCRGLVNEETEKLIRGRVLPVGILQDKE